MSLRSTKKLRVLQPHGEWQLLPGQSLVYTWKIEVSSTYPRSLFIFIHHFQSLTRLKPFPELLSICQMFTDGDKFWLSPHTDSENLENFIREASLEVTKMRGSPEYGKEPCHCFHINKAFFFSPKWLLEHGIRFSIILQQRNDIVITDTNGFHEIINTVENVTMARNLCIGVGL